LAESTGDPGLADAGRASEILPRNSSSTFRSSMCTILESVNALPLCDPSSTVAVCTSRWTSQMAHAASYRHG
jgi:hypothetical protein